MLFKTVELYCNVCNFYVSQFKPSRALNCEEWEEKKEKNKIISSSTNSRLLISILLRSLHSPLLLLMGEQ